MNKTYSMSIRVSEEELNKLNELYKKIYAYYEKNFGSGSVSM